MRNKMDQMFEDHESKVKELEFKIKETQNELRNFLSNSTNQSDENQSFVVSDVLNRGGTGRATKYQLGWEEGSISQVPAEDCDRPELIGTTKLNKKN